MDGAHRFVEQQIATARTNRSRYWKFDGYEVQKVLAAVDWFDGRRNKDAKIGVVGYAEGGQGSTELPPAACHAP